MNPKDRTTLKSYFREGALPTASQYHDLINSSVNRVDDGFQKSNADGLQLSSVGASLKVMSLYQNVGTRDASWSLEHGEAKGNLHFRSGPGPDGEGPGTGPAALSLSRDGRTGLGLDAPRWRLDVSGTARMQGRIGIATTALPDVPADGRPHDITGPLTGCQAFEVMAGAGGEENEGRYALLHAIAMNAYNPRNPLWNLLFRRRRIRAQTAVYGSFADRLTLQWVATKEPHHFKLRLRSHANYGKDRFIRYYLTRLWFDPLMTGSAKGPDPEGGDLM